jgi:hypothetical protein
MATKTKTAKTSDAGFTPEQMATIQAMMAKAFADGQAAGRKRKMPADPGLHVVELTAADTGKNILARVVFNAPGHPSIVGTAGMNEARKIWAGVAIGSGWTPGIRVVDGEPGDLSAIVAHVAENAPAIEAALLKAAAKAAKNHVFVARPKADAAE